MSNIHYNWKRFWCPRDGVIDLSDDGFLCDPETEYFKYVKSDVVSFEEISAKPCLILLGEPGIGKSTALSDEFKILSRQSQKCLYRNLGIYGDETRLISEIFGSTEFEEWKKGEDIFYLFLDSLDECKLRIEQVGLIFKDEFGKIKDNLNRLHLRITSRTADFPNTFENTLPTLWGKNNIGIYEMAPLRKKDVKDAANANSIEPEEFVHRLVEKEIVPLAIKPVTLEFIIQIYKEKGALPESKLDLYQIGCKKLCEESNLNRRERNNAVNSLTTDQKYGIASKIAAVSVFCNKATIYTGIEQPLLNNEISVSEFQKTDTSLNEFVIREVLNTGLFSSRGSEKFGFAHQTYAEFLTADYINTGAIDLSEILKLFIHSGSSNLQVVPQLFETAAWFATYNKSFFDVIAQNCPEVLLHSDLSGADNNYIESLTDNILLKANSVEIKEDRIDSYYHKLKHPNLHIQLKKFLDDKSKHFLARRIAIKIIEVCNEKRSLTKLNSIIFDREDGFQIRKKAAYAINKIGDTKSKLKLKHFIVNQEDDPEDELKGCALKALWPDHLSAKELFENLTLPRKSHLVGAYSMFLYHLRYAIEDIPICELVYALNWIQLGYWEELSFREMKDSIMSRTWTHLLDVPDLIEPFAKALYTVLSRYKGISSDKNKDFNATIIAESEKRHKVINAIMPLFIEKEGNLHFLFSHVPLIVEDDLPWLISQCQGVTDKNEKILWCKLISYLCGSFSHKFIDIIIEAKSSDSDISEALSFLDPIEMDSAKGRKIKTKYLKHERLMKRLNERKDKPLLKPSPIERVIQLLDRFENGEKNAWWQLNREMTLEPNSKYYGHDVESDITKFPVWKQADDDLKMRLFNAAEEYILSPPDLDMSWIGTNIINRPFMAGYRAFVLIMNLDPEKVISFGISVWKKWAPIFISFHLNTEENDESHILLMKIAYENAPDEILSAFSKIIDYDNETYDFIFLKQRLLNCWDEKLAALLFEKAQASHIKYKSKESLFDSLFEHKYLPALDYAKEFIQKPLPTEENLYKLYIYFAACLVIYYPENASELVFPKIHENDDVGRDIIIEISKEREYRHGNISAIANRIPEEDIAKIYIWIEKRYPPKDDPVHQGAYSPGDRDNIADFRNGLIRNLTDRGTFEACEQLAYIYRQLPKNDWLKWTMIDARENALRNTWTPVTPEQLLSLFNKSALYIVRNENDLQEVIIDWFEKFQGELQGETYAAPDLWNTNNPMQPKDENNFSDYIKRNLQRDIKILGIAALREVEVRRGLGNKEGEETDIYVTAFISGELLGQKQKIVVIIESKGCWHAKILTAMKTQLVDRYLKDNQCRHGIYLVGWFSCPQCKKTNCATKQCKKTSMNDLRDILKKQANQLSQNGTIVREVVLDASLR